MDLTAFPGGDLVQEGLADLARGVESIPALLVLIGAHRLRRIGLHVPETAIPSPEHRLYEKLAETDPDSAHSRYNALVRRLVSFENTAECVGLSLTEAQAQELDRRVETYERDRDPGKPWKEALP
jgi:putative addiction module component (TIGR02574 family)